MQKGRSGEADMTRPKKRGTKELSPNALYPTDPLTILELHNTPIIVPEAHKICRSTELEVSRVGHRSTYVLQTIPGCGRRCSTTEYFSISGIQNPTIDEFYVVRKRRSTDKQRIKCSTFDMTCIFSGPCGVREMKDSFQYF